MGRWASLVLLVGLAGNLALPSAARAEDVNEILRKADEVRNPSDSYLMTIQVVSSDGDDTFVFQVSLKGSDKSLVETMKPSSSAGKKYLMLGENMWAFTPKMARPARVSLSQKLTGMAANGDISRMRWFGDYTPTLEKEDAKSWTLLLTANKHDLTYDKLRVWIAKGKYHPIKAEFLTPKGAVLKLATYGGFKNLLGQDRPTEVVITDAHNQQQRSTLTILEMKNKTFPDSIFNQNALK